MLPKFFLLPALAAAAALLSHPAQAERVTVPFAFTALDHSFPPGVYDVEENLNKNSVTVHCEGGPESFTWIMGPGDPAPGDQHITLRFIESANGKHVLESVQYRDQITSKLSKHHDRKAGAEMAGGR